MNIHDYIPYFFDQIYIIDKESPVEENPLNEKNENELEQSFQKNDKIEITGLGHYEKKVLIIIDHQMPLDEEKILLLKIFKAIHILLKDVKITSQPISIKTILDYKIDKPFVMIHFTENEELIKYEYIRKDEIYVLYVDALPQLKTNTFLKKKLWDCLKTGPLYELGKV